jgi:hypothetical protein
MVARRLAALMALALCASCEIGSTTIPRADPTLVIHAVLNPSQRTQFVLVEESLTGKQAVINEGPYDPSNPIQSGNGVPVSGAVVTLMGANGQVMTATELRSEDGGPTGIYAIPLDAYNQPGAPARIATGTRYTLRVEALGQVATASTLVPVAASPVATPLVPFNRDRQAVNLPIKDVQLARAYWIYVSAPVAPFSVFTLDQQVAISGDARNLFTDDLIRLFFPGFVQTLVVAAVDSNLYDYYRSGSDPFSGAGLISSIDGGLGLFGSMVVVERRNLDVGQDPTGDPLEDTFTLRAGGDGGPHTLRLYLEAEGPTEDSADRISGSWIAGPAFAPVRGAVLGSRRGERIALEILEGQSTARVDEVYTLEMRGDTLQRVGRSTVYVRVGK